MRWFENGRTYGLTALLGDCAHTLFFYDDFDFYFFTLFGLKAWEDFLSSLAVPGVVGIIGGTYEVLDFGVWFWFTLSDISPYFHGRGGLKSGKIFLCLDSVALMKSWTLDASKGMGTLVALMKSWTLESDFGYLDFPDLKINQRHKPPMTLDFLSSIAVPGEDASKGTGLWFVDFLSSFAVPGVIRIIGYLFDNFFVGSLSNFCDIITHLATCHGAAFWEGTSEVTDLGFPKNFDEIHAFSAPFIYLLHEYSVGSDHCGTFDHSLILIRPHGMVDSGFRKDRPFRFSVSWLLHDDFPNVKDSWQMDWHWSLNTFQDKIKGWNRDVFGNIFRKKERLLRRLQGIHNRLSMGLNLFLSNLQEELWFEYENTQEEILWMQKSREQWIVNGDCNTRFFHVFTMVRRKRNKVDALKDERGDWVYDLEVLKMLFYKNLYSDELNGRRGLVNQKDALWARVLRAKYRCGDDLIPKVGRINTASRLWKGIVDSWKYVQEGMVWCIGDGKRVRFWSDPWLPNGVVLCHYSLVPLFDADLDKVAADFVSPSGS
ncbi:ribonuclease H [Senna tora]|uniref:Ribonuclease H n=1 Tax=Senna tora TaxID=362788 RepID=A0A834T0I4_9FABA|nr:ribonuclease H [Senna tora]